MKVLLVTTWDTPCGIAEHSRALKAAVEAVDSGIEVVPYPEALAPEALFTAPPFDVLHLNYHAALHSRWTPLTVRRVREAGYPVVVTFHDTEVPNSVLCTTLVHEVDRMVVHEPCRDLPNEERVVYLRQGVPARRGYFLYGTGEGEFCFKQWPDQPVLGSVGFPFPWKNYPLLAEATAAAGWGLLLLAPGASADDVAAWRERNPAMLVVTDFVPAQTVVAYLGGCDATAFLYTCANTGTSGAIRQGIAARKPVIASVPEACRQFRDLHLDTLGHNAIRWITPSLDGLVTALSRVPIQRVDAGIVALAEQDSWVRAGRVYAGIYHSLVGK